MPVDKDVQEYIEAQIFRAATELRQRVETDCAQCRHATRNDMQGMQLLHSAQEQERVVLGTKLDQLKESVDSISHSLAGNGRGSMETRLAVVENQTELAKEDRQALKVLMESMLEGKRRTMQDILIGLTPQLINWVGIAAVVIIYLASKGGVQLQLP